MSEEDLERLNKAFWKLVDILVKKQVISTDDEVTITEAQEEE